MYQDLPDQPYIQQLSLEGVIFGYQDRQLKVLVANLNFNGDFHALPSGFVRQEEDLDEAAQRMVELRTGLADIHLQQVMVFGRNDRKNKVFLDRLIALNPDLPGNEEQKRRTYDWFTRRFISIGYYALVDIQKVNPRKMDIDASILWYGLHELPPLIMDHREIVDKALYTLRRDLDEKLNAFKLLPETFTMKEVQRLYEAIYDRSFTRSNFQKKILDLQVLERLGKKYTGAANKAPYVYRFKRENRFSSTEKA